MKYEGWSTRCRVYLHIERLMLALEEKDDDVADCMADVKAPYWFRLSGEEQRRIRDRGDFHAVLAMHGLPTEGLTDAPTHEEPDPDGGVRLVLDGET